MQRGINSRYGRSKSKPGERIIQNFEPGASTAVPSNVMYRLGKLRDLGLLAGKWLDCGCADGGYTTALVDLGVDEAIGIDPQEERINRAKSRPQPLSSVRFFCASAEAMPFSDESFDGVLLNEVLEHVTNEIQVLREIHRVLRPKGHLIVMSPNRWCPFEGHGMHIGKLRISVPIPILPWIPSRVARYFICARNYWPSELHNLVCREGFVICVASFVLPVFEVFPWLPLPIIRRYRELIPVLERYPFIQRFGVSNFIVAQKL